MRTAIRDGTEMTLTSVNRPIEFLEYRPRRSATHEEECILPFLQPRRDERSPLLVVHDSIDVYDIELFSVMVCQSESKPGYRGGDPCVFCGRRCGVKLVPGKTAMSLSIADAVASTGDFGVQTGWILVSFPIAAGIQPSSPARQV